MSTQLRGSCLFLVFFLTPVALAGQHVESHESDTLDPGSQTPAATTVNPDLSKVTDLIVTLTNGFRHHNGRHEVKVNPQLQHAARGFAAYLAQTDKFSHTADGKTPSQRVSAQGYTACIVAENIAWEFNSEGFSTEDLARDFVRGWRHSPEHRRNLLDPDVEEIGVAVARSERTGRYYAVQDFGRPRANAIVFTIANETNTTIRYTVDGKSFSLDPRYTITHERCRPPELEFLGSQVRIAIPHRERDTLHPRNATHYVVRRDGRGGYVVEMR
jgi:uncharacterized protein YkwD